MIKELVYKLTNNQSLSFQEAYDCMSEILKGNFTPVQIGAFLCALSAKGEVKEELMGFLKAIHEQMIQIDKVEDVVDTCGTGGDMLGSFNTSTAAALVASAAGAKVAKCGNRSSSSLCGSADLLEELGIKIELLPDEAENWVKESGFAFLFTPKFHPSLRKLSPLRKEIGVPTAFNLLGPLGNPMSPKRHLLGVSNRTLAPLYAELLLELGAKHSLVVHGLDGMDEISLSAPSELYEIRNGYVKKMLFDPASLGLEYISHEDISGGDAHHNKNMLIELFDGQKNGVREIVCLNAGVTLMLAGQAEDFREGLIVARKAIDSGLAKEKLNELMNRSKEGVNG
ncbi:anthranilate phosphoribosyltransferase [Bacillus sp. WMMC1349]|uniref:anthranilate phosphoribosyltransferase n=1 Tax=Bacillus sp. WMMC1349 TaxID=2736254 RepID=UPI00155533CC|nr:anthranilate phosphoribosyltransferase [Bacillus sp. WMMC1349]NPC91329.1 anthranilate phosphoribosyltransferase [Bacillus sp. WMMC1349]